MTDEENDPESTSDDTLRAPEASPKKRGTAKKKGFPRLALGVTLCTAIGTITFFAAQRAYLEPSHIALLFVGLGCSVAFYPAVKSMRILGTIVFGLLFTVTLYAAQAKFEWRKDYIQEGFPLDFYIEDYPSYEDYMLAPITGKTDWIRFYDECVKPVENNKNPAPTCTSLGLIQSTYNIDMRKVMRWHFSLMKQTATRIVKDQSGTFTRERYRRCIEQRACAPVPLLPKGVDPKQIDPQSKRYIETRRIFWSIVDKEEITPQICDHMKICRILKKLGAVDPEKLKI